MAVGERLDRPREGTRFKSSLFQRSHCINTILFVDVYAIIFPWLCYSFLPVLGL